MRTFIGLEFDRKLKEKLFTIQNILKVDTIKGSWVNNSNFHMTLKFLGEIKEEQIYDIIEKEVQTIGFEIDTRRFKPHITIGRRIIINKPFNEIKEIVKDELKYDFILDNLALMKSE